jgi:aminoglycoside 3-N-acetyltransferase
MDGLICVKSRRSEVNLMTHSVTNENAVTLLSQDWANAGVRKGDLLLLHSNIRTTLRRMRRLGFALDVETILDSFLHALSEDGTLLLPLFNFDFCSGIRFDMRNTPSQMGALTEAGRIRSGAVRTGNPIYSFAALGKRRDLFRGINNFSGYGADSPFAILHQQGGKIAVLDLADQHSMTFYHYVEQSVSVDYRFHKEFTAPYTNCEGKTADRTYSLFVRKIDEGVVTRVDAMGEMLWAKGLYSGDRPGSGCGLRVIDSRALYDEVAGVIAQGKARGTLYEIQKTPG